MAKDSFCPRCDIRKVVRSPGRDKIIKLNGDGSIAIEHLGYDCRRCGRPWLQTIDYKKAGRKVIKWIKA